MKKSLRAFTLIELLTVIAIIAILAAIIMPSVIKFRHQAQGTTALSNIRQIGAAALLYANDHDGKVPGLGNDTTTNGMGGLGALYPYIASRPPGEFPSWDELKKTFYEIRDPRLPKELLSGGYKWVGFNRLFSDYPQTSPSGKLRDKKLRLVFESDFENPGQVIYAATGNNNLKAEDADNPAQLPLPESPRTGFYFCHDGAVPVVFLDGRAEMLSFPIDPQLLDPFYEPNN